MRKGEKGILFVIVGFVIFAFIWKIGHQSASKGSKDKGIPFYIDVSKAVQQEGHDLYRKYGCKECHSLWSVRSYMQSVPAPAMDGIGMIRNKQWLFNYLSAINPQSILPSRLKKKYQMPSFSALPESERRMLATYLAGLKVEDWYLYETKKAEYEKLTGKDYLPKP